VEIELKRIYDPPAPDDGYRILVDRLWPRGVSKTHAELSLWLKTIAPSTELREWFGHSPARWQEFRQRYRAELENQEEALAIIYDEVKKHPKITFLYSAKDKQHNNAVVLLEYINDNGCCVKQRLNS
jgi:uncharacterized protein YeaO (DUF488 family)